MTAFDLVVRNCPSDPDGAILELAGLVDPVAVRACADSLARAGVRRIVLDVSRLVRPDASMLVMVVDLARRMRISLSGAPDFLRRLLAGLVPLDPVGP